MAFDFSAFLGGFAESAAGSIEKRNKEIRERALSDFERLRKEAEEKEEKNKTKRDELRTTADVLSSYTGKDGKGFTQDQIIGLLQNPGVAKRVQAQLDKNADSLEQVDFNTLFTVSKGKSDLTVDDYIKARTTAPEPTELEKAPMGPTKGAFGLPSRAAARAEADFQARTGKSAAELRAAARGVGEETDRAQGTLDFGQFKQPEATTTIKNKLRDNLSKDIPIEDPRNAPLLKQLRAAAVIESTFEVEKDKDRSAAQIGSVIDKTLRTTIDPTVWKGVVQYDDKLQDWVPITGDGASIKRFMDTKNLAVRDTAIALGVLSKDGTKVTGGRAARDALLPYANIDEEGKIIGWRTITGKAEPKAEPTPAPAGGTATPAPTGKAATPPIAPNIDTLRADALEKIAMQPALAARVRADFKKMTGQEL